jgi:hypothetical protein
VPGGPGDDRVASGGCLAEGLAKPAGDALVEQVELPFADHGNVAAPVEVGEDLGEGNYLGEGDGGLAGRAGQAEPAGSVLPAAAEPRPAVWILRPARRDPPRRADAGGGPFPVAAAGQELLVAPVRGEDLGGGVDIGLRGFGGAAEPSQVTAAKQR